MALELLSQGITVNSISPGMVDTTSFSPKDKGRPGVRSAESVKGAFMALLESGKSGQYIHVDEYDTAVAQGEKKSTKQKTFSTLQKQELKIKFDATSLP